MRRELTRQAINDPVRWRPRETQTQEKAHYVVQGEQNRQVIPRVGDEEPEVKRAVQRIENNFDAEEPHLRT